jgi:3-hydroxy acid dehydrogenase / malonic semialdehyde reductase
MFSIKNLVVLITGASSGIGLACARIFAQAGAKIVLSARRSDRLEALSQELQKEFNTDVHILPMDVTQRSQVESQLSTLPEDWSKIDILINNAGLSRGLDKLYEGDIQDWEEMIDTNVKGLLYVTRSVVPGMVERGRGHVINIGSLAGHQTYPKGNVYCGTKVAVRAISEGLKQDLLGTPLRVTSVDPGLVETEFSKVRFRGDEDRAEGVYQGLTPLTPEDVADTVFYCATRPPHVNINEVLMMPTDQSGSTLVYRQP